MKKRSYGWLVPVLLAVSACHNGHNNNMSDYPDNFGAIGDAGRVAYMMGCVSADSVARFICDASLGRIEGVRIDTFANATLYAYENYKDTALMAFSEEYDRYVEELPLADKMRLYAMAGVTDPQGMGYQLGLEYVGRIREKSMGVADVEKELEALRKACADDTVTYARFIKGFRTVLKVDHGKDLPEEIYSRFADE